jgi:hypothetical protein
MSDVVWVEVVDGLPPAAPKGRRVAERESAYNAQYHLQSQMDASMHRDASTNCATNAPWPVDQ